MKGKEDFGPHAASF